MLSKIGEGGWKASMNEIDVTCLGLRWGQECLHMFGVKVGDNNVYKVVMRTPHEGQECVINFS